MKHGSLFSGIGGFDLAAEWMGWENIFHCEWNEFGKTILKYYWPNAKSYGDITKTDFTIHRGEIDILTGGFPCQPFSHAGKRKGNEDDRFLWPQMLRVIHEVKPRFIVAENVPGIISIERGVVFEQVQSEMEDEGYEVQTIILPACAVDAPHRRDRVWFVANSKSQQSTCETIAELSQQEQREFRGVGLKAIIPDPDCIRQERQGRPIEQMYSKENGNGEIGRAFNVGRWQSVSPICRGDYGLSRELSEKCLEGFGNAIVPQVAYEIFKAIDHLKSA